MIEFDLTRRARSGRFADWPLALKSILGLWLFYYLTVVARAFLTKDPGTVLFNRSINTVLGIILTIGVYVAFAYLARSATLRKRVVIGLVASLVAGGTQAGLLISADRFLEKPQEEMRFVSREGYTVIETGNTMRLERPGREALVMTWPRLAQLEPDAVIPAYVEREFSFTLDGDRVRGRWDRVDVEPAVDTAVASDAAASSAPHADTIAPTLNLTGRERVTITDYKSSDVRDPVKARQRARDSLQLQIYAMGYEAMTGRLPDYLQMHFLDSGLVGRVPVEPARLTKARQKIATAAAGMRARDYTAKPDRMACGYCPYREICPSAAV